MTMESKTAITVSHIKQSTFYILRSFSTAYSTHNSNVGLVKPLFLPWKAQNVEQVLKLSKREANWSNHGPKTSFLTIGRREEGWF